MLAKGDQAVKLGKEEVEEIRMRKTKVDEKVAFASSQEVGNSLQAVTQLLKKNKLMQAETEEIAFITVHDSGIMEVKSTNNEKEAGHNAFEEKWLLKLGGEDMKSMSLYLPRGSIENND